MLSLQWTEVQLSFSDSEWIELTQIGPVSVLYNQDLPVSVGEINITCLYAGVQD